MLSVVVPTFNEGKNIRNLVTQIDEALKGIGYEILFVDDSSQRRRKTGRWCSCARQSAGCLR